MDQRDSISEDGSTSGSGGFVGGLAGSSAPPLPIRMAPTKLGLDRQKSCPMYVRFFCRMHGHHRLEEFTKERQPVEDEVDVYTWKDASLKELSDLIKEVNLECRRRDAKFSFRLVYADYRGRFGSKALGMVSNSRNGRDDTRTLEELRFVQGDFIDVAIGFGAEALGTMMERRPETTTMTFGRRQSVDNDDRDRGGRDYGRKFGRGDRGEFGRDDRGEFGRDGKDRNYFNRQSYRGSRSGGGNGRTPYGRSRR